MHANIRYCVSTTPCECGIDPELCSSGGGEGILSCQQWGDCCEGFPNVLMKWLEILAAAADFAAPMRKLWPACLVGFRFAAAKARHTQ